MNQMRVVFCFDVEDFFPSEERPLMLETVLFCPVLRWMGVQMKADGVKRFFVMCPDAYAKEAAACFDAEDDVIVSANKPIIALGVAPSGIAGIVAIVGKRSFVCGVVLLIALE